MHHPQRKRPRTDSDGRIEVGVLFNTRDLDRKFKVWAMPNATLHTFRDMLEDLMIDEEAQIPDDYRLCTRAHPRMWGSRTLAYYNVQHGDILTAELETE